MVRLLERLLHPRSHAQRRPISETPKASDFSDASGGVQDSAVDQSGTKAAAETADNDRPDTGSAVAAQTAANNEPDTASVAAETAADNGADPTAATTDTNLAVIDIESDLAHSDQWTAAYRKAVASLSEDERTLVTKGRDIVELFENLSEANHAQKSESTFRRVLEKVQKPMQYLDQSLDLAKPLTSLDPSAGTAFGIVHSVTLVSQNSVW